MASIEPARVKHTMNNTNIELSFIIPAYNEETLISDTINSIQKHVPTSLTYDINVIDHDSSDKTSQIASKLGANVFAKSGGSIASVRNFGASCSKGNILIFLDADVILTNEWMQHIQNVVDQIIIDRKILTGSWVSIPDGASWIEKCWYGPLQRGDNTHINTGHLIIAKDYFFEIGGFSEHLETGEDYEFSMRVNHSGGKLIDNYSLIVIHTGFPTDLREFVKREFWHGKGDAKTISSILRSKVAVLSLLFLAFHAIFFTSIILGKCYIAGLSTAFIIVIITSSSVVKYSNAPALPMLINCFLYYLYFWARSLSLIVFFGSDKISKHHR